MHKDSAARPGGRVQEQTPTAPSPNIADQQGLANLAAQGNTGINIETPVPLGVVILLAVVIALVMGLMVWNLFLLGFLQWLSHRRAMVRLKPIGVVEAVKGTTP